MTTLQRPPQPARPEEPPVSGAPAGGPSSDAKSTPEPPRLSGIQITASALAAVSSTLALSYLGVAGTIIGAGIASVLTVLGNYVYTRSILRAHERVKAVVPARIPRPAPAATPAQTAAAAATLDRALSAENVLAMDDATLAVAQAEALEDGVQGTLPGFAEDAVASGAPDGAGSDDAGSDDAGSARRRTRRRLALASAAVFAVILAGITMFEMVVGKPLTDVLHGTEGSGSSISKVVTGGTSSREAPVEDAPAVDDGTDTGTDSGTDPQDGTGTGSDSGTDSGTDTGTDAGTDAGTGTDTGTEPDDGTDSGTDPDDGTGTDTGTDPDDGTGTDTGTDPDDGTTSGTESGADPGAGENTSEGTTSEPTSPATPAPSSVPTAATLTA